MECDVAVPLKRGEQLVLLGERVDPLSSALGALPVIVVRPRILTKVVGGLEAIHVDLGTRVQCEHDPNQPT